MSNFVFHALAIYLFQTGLLFLVVYEQLKSISNSWYLSLYSCASFLAIYLFQQSQLFFWIVGIYSILPALVLIFPVCT